MAILIALHTDCIARRTIIHIEAYTNLQIVMRKKAKFINLC